MKRWYVKGIGIWWAGSLIGLVLFLSAPLHARNAGIVVACSDNYVQGLYASLKIIRDFFRCDLPIEVWYAGDELSDHSKSRLFEISDLSLHDIAIEFGGDPEPYRGYHIKGYALYASRFDEVLLIDADVVFFQNPALLLDHPKTKQYGAYFFRDREDFLFHDYNDTPMHYGDPRFTSYFTYKERQEIFKALVPESTESIPPDWRHYWTTRDPHKFYPIPSEHQDAGCVAIDKRRCPKGCELILQLNKHHDFFYRYMLGDKETFWLSLAAAKESFFVNTSHPYRITIGKYKREMIHFLDEKLFFLQKTPIQIEGYRVFISPTGKLSQKRVLLRSEVDLMNTIYRLFQYYENQFEI